MSDGCSCWWSKMHRRARQSCPLTRPPHGIERVKFGAALQEICQGGIPGSLLVLILKLNAEGPYKKEIFRAPGNCGKVKKLIQVLKDGHSVNLQGYSVHTVASVLKIFLQKLPDGIFGRSREEKLFRIMEMDNVEAQKAAAQSVIHSLPRVHQHLLVLLIGMFKLIALNAERARTGMTAEALGVSVAPSILHSCVSNGKQVRMQDVENFKIASRVITFLIENFGAGNLFSKENYEYFANTTRRLFKMNGRWSFKVKYQSAAAASHVLSKKQSSESDSPLKSKGSLKRSSPLPSAGELVSCPELNTYSVRVSNQQLHSLQQTSMHGNSSDQRDAPPGSQPKTAKTDSVLRLSVKRRGHHEDKSDQENSCEDFLDSVDVQSLFDLPEVHERQTQRMKARSEWFLTPTRQNSVKAARIPLSSIDWSSLKTQDATTASECCSDAPADEKSGCSKGCGGNVYIITPNTPTRHHQ